MHIIRNKRQSAKGRCNSPFFCFARAKHCTSPQGFTLIELLIVVAIIAILAAIAVPNFLEAQTRAKISRNKADMRTVTTGIESYKIDWNQYGIWEAHKTGPWLPAGTALVSWPFHLWTPSRLSTPVAYLSSIPEDPFFPLPHNTTWDDPATEWGRGKLYRRHVHLPIKYMLNRTNAQAWYSQALRVGGEYVLMSNGPDRQYYNTPAGGANTDLRAFRDYDSTNGTVSLGNIIRSQKNGDRFGTDPYFENVI